MARTNCRLLCRATSKCKKYKIVGVNQGQVDYPVKRVVGSLLRDCAQRGFLKEMYVRERVDIWVGVVN